MIEFYELDWDTVTSYSIQLAHALPAQSKLYAWPRGGLIPAAIMSQYYGHRLVSCQQLADYVIDDIMDTGKTRNTQFITKSAILVVRKSDKPYPHYFGMELDTDKYILFPWQDRETEEQQIQEKGFRTND